MAGTVTGRYVLSQFDGAQDNSGIPVADTGWFYADPLSITATLPDGRGNVVSSTDQGANAPVDSFMVYIGRDLVPGGTSQPRGAMLPCAEPCSGTCP